MVEKPDWYRNGRNVPGTRYFKLEHLKNKDVFKFMSLVLSKKESTHGFEFAGSEHCNQTGPLGTYRLVEMTLEELRSDPKIKNEKTKSEEHPGGGGYTLGGRIQKGRKATKKQRKPIKKQRKSTIKM
jgi:hypothetical protein